MPVKSIDVSATFAVISTSVKSALAATNPVIATKSAKFGIDANVNSPSSNVNTPAYAATSDAITMPSPFASNAAYVSVAGFAAIIPATYVLVADASNAPSASNTNSTFVYTSLSTVYT